MFLSLHVVIVYKKLSANFGNYRQLSAIIGDYRQLSAIIGDYRQLRVHAALESVRVAFA